jgi:hypothetical protein
MKTTLLNKCNSCKIYHIVIPAQAGIQLIKKSPVKRDNIAVLSADETTSHSTKLAKNASKVAGYTRDTCPCWIPACAGMTD